MDNIIQELESKPFSGEDLLNITDKKTKVIRYVDLKTVRNINNLFKPYNCFIILYETNPSYGHWVCVIKHIPKRGKPYIEFFDPYGMMPDKQLDYISESFLNQQGINKPLLLHLFADSGYDVIYNTKQLQRYANDISTCGRHVSFRIIMKDLPLKEYIKLLTKNKLSPDMLVTYLTAFQ